MRKKPEEILEPKLDAKEIKKDESLKFIHSENAQAQSVIEEKKKNIEAQPTSQSEPIPETICGRHLKDVDDLRSFPIFKDGERGSLLSKFLTKDVWR